MRRSMTLAAALWLLVPLVQDAHAQPAPTLQQAVADAVAAMGGRERLEQMPVMVLRGSATRTRIGQAFQRGAPDPTANLKNLVEALDIKGGRVAFDYHVDLGPFQQPRREVLTRRGETPIGYQVARGRAYVVAPGGLFSWGTYNSPASMLRRNVVSVMLEAAASADAQVTSERDFNGKAARFGEIRTKSGEQIALYFDPQSKLLAGFEVLETEPMLGDVTARYSFSDYKAVDGLTLPYRVTILKGGNPFADVTYTSIAFNDPAAQEMFAVPDAIAAEADRAIADGAYVRLELKKVAPGLYHAVAFSHHSMLVEFPSFVAVVETPISELQSKALGKLVANEIGKPIRYATITHPHWDHTSGIRGMAALGATIVLEKGHEGDMRTVLEAPHSSPPDELARRRAAGQPLAIETFEGKRVISEGGQSLELHALSGSPHAQPFVIAYVPGAKAVFQSDLWVPGVGATSAGPAAVHLQAALRQLNLPVDLHVGGHGGVGPADELTKLVDK
jgi:glyoxylase-like metal-dependent hydrolase (beta-lactamase superfamily II)